MRAILPVIKIVPTQPNVAAAWAQQPPSFHICETKHTLKYNFTRFTALLIFSKTQATDCFLSCDKFVVIELAY